jgi:hypothetical protein
LIRSPVSGRGDACLVRRARAGRAGLPVIQRVAPAETDLRSHSFFSGVERAPRDRTVQGPASPSWIRDAARLRFASGSAVPPLQFHPFQRLQSARREPVVREQTSSASVGLLSSRWPYAPRGTIVGKLAPANDCTLRRTRGRLVAGRRGEGERRAVRCVRGSRPWLTMPRPASMRKLLFVFCSNLGRRYSIILAISVRCAEPWRDASCLPARLARGNPGLPEKSWLMQAIPMINLIYEDITSIN